MLTLPRLFAAVALTIGSAGSALAAPPVGGHNELATLPISGMSAAVKNGKLAFVSSNGRFIFQGKMFDNWNQKEITTLAEAKEANDFMNLKKLDFRVADLKPLVVGSGPKEIVVFYDPYCPSCHHLLDDAEQVEGYTFNFIAIPAMGEQSIKAVRAAFCVKDEKLSHKLLMGKVKPADLPKDDFLDCDTTAIAKRVVSSQLFGIQGVPFMVRDDGLIRHGYLKGDLNNWLAGGN